MNSRFFLSSITTALVLVASLMASCKRDDKVTPLNTPSTAKVNMYLTDAPANYDAVYIDIQKVEVTMEGSAAITVDPVRPGVYNLLKLKNGLDTLLVRADIPAGKISQIRLILGTDNSVVVDGKSYVLNTPSVQESGLKLNLHQDIVAGGSYNMWLDFDAGSSVVETGSGKFNLKPVIAAYDSTTDGRIKGYVLPGIALVTVYASNGVNTYTAIPEADGFFMFKGLPAGTYNITYDATLITYTDITLNNVNVTYGLTTDVGTTVLKP